MSFLLRTLPRQTIRLSASSSTVHATRTFSTTLLARKSATETIKDTVKGVDRAVSDKLVDGIEATQTAAQKAAAATGAKADEAKGKAAEVTGQAKGKAAEVAGEVKGKKEEVAGEVKGKL